MHFVALSICLLALGLLVFSAHRSRELCVLSIEQGETRVTRGRAPAALLEGLADVFARANVQRAQVRILRDGKRARVSATGLDAHVLQRARNVLGTFPAHKLLGEAGSS
jgi:hypothetical protein